MSTDLQKVFYFRSYYWIRQKWILNLLPITLPKHGMSFCILGDIVGDSEEKVGSLPTSDECSLGRRPTWRPARARRVLRVSPSLRAPCPSSSSSSGKTGVSLTIGWIHRTLLFAVFSCFLSVLISASLALSFVQCTIKI